MPLTAPKDITQQSEVDTTVAADIQRALAALGEKTRADGSPHSGAYRGPHPGPAGEHRPGCDPGPHACTDYGSHRCAHSHPCPAGGKRDSRYRGWRESCPAVGDAGSERTGGAALSVSRHRG